MGKENLISGLGDWFLGAFRELRHDEIVPEILKQFIVTGPDGRPKISARAENRFNGGNGEPQNTTNPSEQTEPLEGASQPKRCKARRGPGRYSNKNDVQP